MTIGQYTIRVQTANHRYTLDSPGEGEGGSRGVADCSHTWLFNFV